MNFLTHLHLADISRTHLAANLAGNYITAPIANAPAPLRQGLWLNQEINQLCTTHELTQELMALFPTQLISIAADLMYVSFDHYLARKPMKSWLNFPHKPMNIIHSHSLA